MKSIGIIMLLLIPTGCDAPASEPQPQDGTAKTAASGGSEEAVPKRAPPVEELERFKLSQQEYAVPTSQIRSIRRGGSNSFVRIKHPDYPIELVFDDKSNGMTDANGAPQIFSVNDGDYPNLTYHPGPGDKIVCRGAASARAGCGMKLSHGNARWSVLFPTNKVKEASQLAEQALALLDRYLVQKEASSQEEPTG